MRNQSLEFKNIKEYLEKGAIVLDVRTEAEYNEGHVKDAIHIVLDELEYEIDQLKEFQKPIITCCRSGARSERAKELLLDENFDVINGGPWQNIENYI
nr:rhodanese-like domain-containing protein [uncultured Psychroserpens sp.]